MSDERDIFVVSDLHLGDGGPRDNFAFDGKAEQFVRFLDHVESEGGQLYILGDLFDFWQANLGQVMCHYSWLLDRFAKMEARYVVGNHDWDLAALAGKNILGHPFFSRMSGPFDGLIGDRRFCFMHGHEVEPFNNDQRPGWGRILAILGGIIEDKKGSPMLSAGGATEKGLLKIGRCFMITWNLFVNLFEKGKKSSRGHEFETELTPSQNPQRVPAILKLYAKHRSVNGYDVIIAGHTHKTGCKGDWYYNSGCWVGLRNNFLRITANGEIQLFDWKDGQAEISQ